MPQELGESREAWGWDVWRMAENFANNMKKEKRPFYIVYAAKQDKIASEKYGTGVYRQTIKAYFSRPPKVLGVLVWYVDNRKGTFEFVPELSSPPDVPLDPSLLSDKASDASERVAKQGKDMKVIVS
jgi:hypothetical protein